MVSGLHPATNSPYSDSISLRLPYSVNLATECKSLTHYTKGTQSPGFKGSRRALKPVAYRLLAHARSLVAHVHSAQIRQPPNLLDSSAFTPECLLSRSLNATLLESTLVKALKAGLPLFVCIRFQDLFHSPPGVLFAFPSRYLFTIGRLRVFSLGGWSPHIQTGFHVSRPTLFVPSSTIDISHTGLSPAMAGLSIPF